jgi:hypothetical protein
MPPRNPTTRCSPRAPKLKEAETGEGSSPGTVRQLEYTPRVELVIKTSTKKAFVQPPVFGDTEASTWIQSNAPTVGGPFQQNQPGRSTQSVSHTTTWM